MTFTSHPHPHRKNNSEGTFDLPQWDRTGLSSICMMSLSWRLCVSCCFCAADWWKSMKQLLPSRMMEMEDSIRYSTSEVGRLSGRGAVPRLHAEPAGRWDIMGCHIKLKPSATCLKLPSAGQRLYCNINKKCRPYFFFVCCTSRTLIRELWIYLLPVQIKVAEINVQ